MCQCDGGRSIASYHHHPLSAPRPCEIGGDHPATRLLVPPHSLNGSLRCERHSPKSREIRSLHDPDLDDLLFGMMRDALT